MLAAVLRMVPVLDADGGPVAAGAVVGIGRDVADGVGVLDAGDGEVLVDGDGAVFFEFDGWILLEVVGGGPDADAEDDEVGGERGAVFEFDGADGGEANGGGDGGGRHGGVDASVHVEFRAVFLEGLAEDGADFGAHDAFEGLGFHADD